MLIRCQSHEGAYTALYPERRSWTWFGLAKLEAGGGANHPPIPGPKLVHNDLLEVHHTRQTHEFGFLAESPERGGRSGDAVGNWIRRLKHGGRVAIVPMARWPGRVNTVWGPRIEIWTSLLKNSEEGQEEWEGEIEVDGRRTRGNNDTLVT